MPFQTSAFQPTRKPSLRSRLGSAYRAVYAFAAPAKGLSPLEESAWQRGKRQTSELANGRAVMFMVICGPIFGAVGVNVIASESRVWRSLLGAVLGLVGALIAASIVASVYAVLAPYQQRREAREYARALEAYASEYAQWARRREIAYDFRHDILADARRISGEGILMGSVADEEDRWRTILTQIGPQMRANGADVWDFIETQLAALDDPDNAYGGDDIARIRNSMLAACQNLLSEVRQEGPPKAPTPPTGGTDQ